jgi:hypothetical protein
VRRSLNKTGRYVRKPNKDPKSNELMEDHGVGYSSTGLVAQMREQDNLWKQGDVTVKLAKAYGYCWGVERAVRMAYEARNSFPDKRVHITNEIIHNPEVNQVRSAAAAASGGGSRRTGQHAARWQPLCGVQRRRPARQPASTQGGCQAGWQTRAAHSRLRCGRRRPAAACPGRRRQCRPPSRNPDPPQRLRELDINIFEDEAKGKDYSTIKEGDVVIFPAFGATVQEMQLFRDKNVEMVDTTCPWVAKVRGGGRGVGGGRFGRRQPGWRGKRGCSAGGGPAAASLALRRRARWRWPCCLPLPPQSLAPRPPNH